MNSEENFNKCKNCMKVFGENRKPIILTNKLCGHSFCRDCLSNFLNRRNKEITCITCHNKTKIPNNDLSLLPVNQMAMEQFKSMETFVRKLKKEVEKELEEEKYKMKGFLYNLKEDNKKLMSYIKENKGKLKEKEEEVSKLQDRFIDQEDQLYKQKIELGELKAQNNNNKISNKKEKEEEKDSNESEKYNKISQENLLKENEKDNFIERCRRYIFKLEDEIKRQVELINSNKILINSKEKELSEAQAKYTEIRKKESKFLENCLENYNLGKENRKLEEEIKAIKKKYENQDSDLKNHKDLLKVLMKNSEKKDEVIEEKNLKISELKEELNKELNKKNEEIFHLNESNKSHEDEKAELRKKIISSSSSKFLEIKEIKRKFRDIIKEKDLIISLKNSEIEEIKKSISERNFEPLKDIKNSSNISDSSSNNKANNQIMKFESFSLRKLDQEILLSSSNHWSKVYDYKNIQTYPKKIFDFEGEEFDGFCLINIEKYKNLWGLLIRDMLNDYDKNASILYSIYDELYGEN